MPTDKNNPKKQKITTGKGPFGPLDLGDSDVEGEFKSIAQEQAERAKQQHISDLERVNRRFVRRLDRVQSNEGKARGSIVAGYELESMLLLEVQARLETYAEYDEFKDFMSKSTELLTQVSDLQTQLDEYQKFLVMRDRNLGKLAKIKAELDAVEVDKFAALESEQRDKIIDSYDQKLDKLQNEFSSQKGELLDELSAKEKQLMEQMDVDSFVPQAAAPPSDFDVSDTLSSAGEEADKLASEVIGVPSSQPIVPMMQHKFTTVAFNQVLHQVIDAGRILEEAKKAKQDGSQEKLSEKIGELEEAIIKANLSFENPALNLSYKPDVIANQRTELARIVSQFNEISSDSGPRPRS